MCVTVYTRLCGCACGRAGCMRVHPMRVLRMLLPRSQLPLPPARSTQHAEPCPLHPAPIARCPYDSQIALLFAASLRCVVRLRSASAQQHCRGVGPTPSCCCCFPAYYASCHACSSANPCCSTCGLSAPPARSASPAAVTAAAKLLRQLLLVSLCACMLTRALMCAYAHVRAPVPPGETYVSSIDSCCC